MSKKAKLFRDGKFVKVLDEASSHICAVGESISFELNMMDSMDPLQRVILQDSMTPRAPQHAPGYMQIADAEYDRREQSITDRKKKLSDAWKNTPTLAPDKPAITPGTLDARDAALERRDRQLENAWRGA